MHTTLIFQLLVLLVVANGAPVLVKKALGDQLAQPFDGGAVLPDGRPLFGSSKTVRGVVSSFLATPLVALLMGFQWEVGALVAGGAVAGDLFSSFVKRRLGFPPSSMALGLDQIPESLFPLAACRLLLPVTCRYSCRRRDLRCGRADPITDPVPLAPSRQALLIGGSPARHAQMMKRDPGRAIEARGDDRGSGARRGVTNHAVILPRTRPEFSRQR